MRLRSYDWPGTVRELHNVLERAAILTRDGIIRPEDLPELNSSEDTAEVPSGGTLKQRVDSYERSLIEEALRSLRFHREAPPRKTRWRIDLL